MPQFIRRINTLFIASLFFLLLLSPQEVQGQSDSLRLAPLIQQMNYLLMYPPLLSPFEIWQHNRDQVLKNIEWVDGFEVYRQTSSKTDTIPYIVKDNQTIIQKPDDRFNSRTYVYYDDGRLHKTFRGSHLNDTYVNDKKGYLIQHGSGGELKKAKRKDRVFKWYNVKYKRLEYITSFDQEDRLLSIQTMGHYFGPAVENQTEEYVWEGNQLQSTNQIMNYKSGGADTTFFKLTYDSLGLISSTSFRSDDETRWSTNQLETKIEYLENDHIKISIFQSGTLLLSYTFDGYDNMVEMRKPTVYQKRVIDYREEKRRK